jgi:hypothetical protein
MSRLRTTAKTGSAQAKKKIQALLRTLTIRNDGGCFLRLYPEAGACGGYGPRSGKLVLQADHINSRGFNVSYGDMRNILCICSGHHGGFKTRNPGLYMVLARKYILSQPGGKVRWEYVERVLQDRKIYPMSAWDWAKVELSLSTDVTSAKAGKTALR